MGERETNKKRFFIFALVFLISFIWMLSFTCNFNFFWEDEIYTTNYENYVKHPDDYAMGKIAPLFINSIASKNQFYNTTYLWKPFESFSNYVIPSIGGVDPLGYRIFRAALFAAFMTVCFSFFYMLSEKRYGKEFEKKKEFLISLAKNSVPYLALAYILALPEIWILVLYIQDTLLFTMFFTLISLALFFLVYNKDSGDQKRSGLFYFAIAILIVFFTQMSVLTKHIGRVNFLVIAAFLLFSNRKKILTWKYSLLILALFCLSFPILWFFNTSGGSFFDITGISQQTGVSENGGIYTLLVTFVKTFHLSFFPHALFLVALFLVFVLVHVYAISKKKKQMKTKYTSELKDIVWFSFFWFVFKAMIFFMARGFVFEPKFFLRFEFSIFLVPQALFLISYSLYVYKSYFPEKKILQYVICLFIILAISQNLVRLNEWRGGWGAYFLGYDTARQYVDEHANNSILLFPPDQSNPAIFTSSNRGERRGDLTNISMLCYYQKRYDSVFIASNKKLEFDDPNSVIYTSIKIKDSSPYGLLKKLIGKYYSEPVYVYKFNNESVQ